MSRGPGHVERALLAALEGQTELVDTFTLTDAVYSPPADESNCVVLSSAQLVATRRALNALADTGKVFRIMRGRNKRAYWAGERLGLWWSIRLGQQRSAEFAGDREAFTRHADRLVAMIERAHEIGVDFHQPFPKQEGSAA